MIDDRKSTKHVVTLDKRENISVTGVLDVLSFDEETVVVETDMGVLVMSGFNLHVSKLNLDVGELEVDGEINSLNYEDDKLSNKKGSFLSKIFK